MRGSARDFDFISKLGEGSFSSVYKARRISDGKIYAVKKVKMGPMTEKERENSLNEIRLLASLDCEYIIKYKDSFFDDETKTLFVVMEYAQNGDLANWIKALIKDGTFFSESQVIKGFLHIAKALNTLHSNNIVHRDVKCANVFLTASGDFKLGDFNVSKQSKSGLVYTQTGTPYYAAPEVWRNRPYDAKCDI